MIWGPVLQQQESFVSHDMHGSGTCMRPRLGLFTTVCLSAWAPASSQPHSTCLARHFLGRAWPAQCIENGQQLFNIGC